MKKIIFVFAMLFMISLVSANLGTFELNECIQIVTNLNASSANISLITTPSPNSEIVVVNQLMTKNGNAFNYTFCNTSVFGVYTYGYCDISGNCYSNDFLVNPSGSPDISSGQGLVFFGSLLVMLIIGIIFLVGGFKITNIAAKIGFFSFSIIVFIMAVLFIIISAQQNLYGFQGLVTGTETFWFVMKTLITIGILAFFIIVGLIIKKAWKIKRGLYE